MIATLLSWRTRTRNKILAVAWGFIVLLDITIIVGWFIGLKDAPAMFGAINGSGGVWAGLNAASIALENIFKSKEKPP